MNALHSSTFHTCRCDVVDDSLLVSGKRILLTRSQDPSHQPTRKHANSGPDGKLRETMTGGHRIPWAVALCLSLPARWLTRGIPLENPLFVCQNDTCPSAFNGRCDRSLCETGDCFDCDPCKEFHYNCSVCIDNGCYFCPTDGTCYHDTYTQLKGATCTNENDFTTSTCTSEENFFRYVAYGLVLLD